MIIQLWNGWDMIYYRCTRLTYVNKGNNIFRVIVKRYQGEPLKTEDGFWLQPGDYYVQIHLHNVLLAKKLRQLPPSEFAWAVMLKKYIRSSLPELFRFVKEHPYSDRIHIILGTTCLYRGATRLGFEVKEVTHPFHKWWKSFGIRIIYLFCHPQGWKNFLRRKGPFIPKRVFMSKEKLKRCLESD